MGLVKLYNFSCMPTQTFTFICIVVSVSSFTILPDKQLTLPSDTPVAYLVHHLNLKNVKSVSVKKSEYSDYFSVQNNGDLFTAQSIIPLSDKSFKLDIEVFRNDRTKDTFSVKIFVKDKSSSNNRNHYDEIKNKNIIKEKVSSTKTIHKTVNTNSIELSRNRRSGSRVTMEKTFSEADGSPIGKVMFHIEKQHEAESFRIRDPNQWVEVDPDGAVLVKKEWNYEKLNPEKIIEFFVIVTDEQNNEGFLKVALTITDVNDEPPVFINRPLPMQTVVDLNTPANTVVYYLLGKEPDHNSKISYILTRDRTGGLFDFNEESGVIRTKESTNFAFDTEYVLYVKAIDQNGLNEDGSFQSTKEHRLSIVGGQRPPQFYLNSYQATVPENASMDHEVITIRAKSFNAESLTYALSGSEEEMWFFSIDRNSGIVKLENELDFETIYKSYRFLVTATDSNEMSSFITLTIDVSDVNDNSPKFDSSLYQAHDIYEDVPIGTSLLKVKAGDIDIISEITYFISDDNFRIDNDGNIYSNNVLDADDNNGRYKFIITAKDGGQPPREGTATVLFIRRIQTMKSLSLLKSIAKQEALVA